MAKVIYKRTVSDENIKIVLQRMATLTNRDITVHSGDRNASQNIKGSPSTSLHNQHRAADFHFVGLTDKAGYDFIKLNMNKIFDATEAYEMIQHRTGGKTEGPHLHVGRYAMGPSNYRRGYVDFKKDGLELGKTYSIERVLFTFIDGTPIRVDNLDSPAFNAGFGGSPTNVEASVGNEGKNYSGDVKNVQLLLNLANLKVKETGISYRDFGGLEENGICSPDTIRAITIFQKDVIRMSTPDGRVDRSGRTLQMLFIAAYSPTDEILQKLHRVKPIETEGLAGMSKVQRENYKQLLILMKDDPQFKPTLIAECSKRGINPDHMLNMIAIESSFQKTASNVFGYIGLGQVGRSERISVGWSGNDATDLARLRAMSASEQLKKLVFPFMEKKFGTKTLDGITIDKLYAGWGSGHYSNDPNYIHMAKKGKRSKAYKNNPGWDYNKDGVTRQWEFGPAAYTKLGAGKFFTWNAK